MNVCACMGPMYGEPHCYCTMQRLGLPLNEEARAIEDERFRIQLDALFAPGGIWYRPPPCQCEPGDCTAMTKMQCMDADKRKDGK